MVDRETEETRGARPAVGRTVEILIDGLAEGGEGVGRADGFAVFVVGALPGERVRARITDLRRSFGRADLLGIVEPSPDRVDPPCPVFHRCGGCQLQHLAPEAALEARRRRVEEALRRIGRLGDVPVLPTLAMAEPWRYRNKALFPLGMTGKTVIAGPYERGSHRIVDVGDCLIQTPLANRILADVKRLLTRHRVPIYDERTHRGTARHVLVRTSRSTGEAMVVLVTRTDDMSAERAFARELMEAVPGTASVWRNINPDRTNVILGPRVVHLAGRPVLEDRLLDLVFEISPLSFFQVNTEGAEALGRLVLAAAAPVPESLVVDAYCGTGTLTLLLARAAARAIGLEVASEAVADARRNAGRNGIANAEFRCGAAEDLLPELAAAGLRPDVVVLDPPRRGCDERVLAATASLGPARLVYVSCDPATLARDLSRLTELGFQAREVRPIDMFPQTTHVESVALLVRRSA